MDTLFAQASESLAKAGMNRRGFLGRLVSATTGAAVLTAGLSTAVRADHCEGSHHCVTCKSPFTGSCGYPCSMRQKNRWQKCRVVDCYERTPCSDWYLVHAGCTGKCPS